MQVAARFDDKAVDLHHFEKAIDRVIGGLEKKNKVGCCGIPLPPLSFGCVPL